MRCAVFVVLGACGHVDFDPVANGAAADAYAAAVITDHPIAYYRFDEPAGPTALDSIGTANGDYQGNFVFGAPGAMGGSYAVTFDNSTTRIDFGDVFAFGGITPYTFELWVHPTIIDDSVRFLISRETDTTPDNGYQLYFNAGFMTFSRTIDDSEMGYVGPTNTSDLMTTGWTHVVVTYDGTLPMMFINGAFAWCNQGGASAINTGAGHFVIGDKAAAQFYKLAGSIDELAIYDYPLDADRIAAHYAAAH